ncbi:MAG: hypothetical protein ACREB0_00120 [Sphingopyxis sp.]
MAFRQIDPASFTNAFNAERDRGTNERRYADSQTQLARQNARQDVADTQQATTFQQGQDDRAVALGAAQSQAKRDALGRVGAVAKQALSLTDPAQRKGFLQQAIPTYGQDFAAIGADTTKLGEMLAMPDDQLTQMLTQASKFAGGGNFNLSKGEQHYEGGKLVASNSAGDDVEYRDAGDRLVPVYKTTGQPVPNLEPIAKGKLPGERANQQFANAANLRGEYNKQAAEFTGASEAYQKIQSSVANPSAAGDIALIFNFMKVLDPSSTVREGEFATVAQSGGLPARVQTLYNKMVNGELPAGVRADVVKRSGELYSGQQKRFNEIVKPRYEGLAKRYGIDPNEVVSSPDAQGAPAQFNTEQEAVAAGIKPGTRVVIGGVSGTWQ